MNICSCWETTSQIKPHKLQIYITIMLSYSIQSFICNFKSSITVFQRGIPSCYFVWLARILVIYFVHLISKYWYILQSFIHLIFLGHISLDIHFKNNIVDMRSNDVFLELKRIGDLTRKMVEIKKDIIYPLVYLLMKLVLTLLVCRN